MMFVIRNDSNLEGSPPNTESSRRKGQVTLQPSRSRSRSNFGNLVRPGVLWQSWFKRAWFPWRSQNIIDKRWFLGTWRRLEAAAARNKPSMLLQGKTIRPTPHSHHLKCFLLPNPIIILANGNCPHYQGNVGQVGWTSSGSGRTNASSSCSR